jgi:CO/xanthine dehydrogenase FAD-binding subunit
MRTASGWSFRELARRSGDYAMAGVAVTLNLDEAGVCESARLIYLNVGDGPLAAGEAAAMLMGEQGGDELFEAVAAHAAEHEIMPFGNLHATDSYQRHLARVLTVRALRAAWNQALNGRDA